MRTDQWSPLCVVALSAVFWLAPAFAQDPPRDPKQIESRLAEIDKLLADELAGEEPHRAALKDLDFFLKASAAFAAREVSRNDAETPAGKIHARIVALRKAVHLRLPDDGEVSSDGDRTTGWPVPAFADEKLVGRLSSALRMSQERLAAEVRKNPGGSRGLDERLVEVSIAQESLAWEAGWPFTEDEVKAFKAAGKLSPEIYLQRRGRGVQRINERLAREAEAVGRPAPPAFAIFSPETPTLREEIAKRLSKSRGAAAPAWAKDTRPFDKMARAALVQRP